MSVHQIGAPGRPFNGVFQYSFEGVDIETIVNGTILETKFHYQEKTFIQKKAYLPQSFCYAFIQYPIQKAEDLKCLRKIYEPVSYTHLINRT